MPARDAEREQVMQQSVTQSLGGGDDRPGALDGLVDSVEDRCDVVAALAGVGGGWGVNGTLSALILRETCYPTLSFCNSIPAAV